MDNVSRLAEIEYRISHRHPDGAWGEMVQAHDSATDDPERQWGKSRLFRCTSCDESVTIERESVDGRPPHA